jgi:peptidyl-prolyl cis-trans isomerase A (cyclophilin A)
MAGENPVVVLDTTHGEIVIELDRERAPLSTQNFLDYVEAGHYDGTIFHRVIPNFMIQGGGFTQDMQQKPTRKPLKNEASNGLKNDRYTVAMARTQVVDSATSQFFINLKDNDFLNHRDQTAPGFGYAVIGKVTSGMQVVDKIANVRTGQRGQHGDVPAEAVVINSARVRQ